MKTDTFLKSFSLKLWNAVGATVIFIIMILTTIQHLRLRYEYVATEDLSIMNSVFLIITIFLQQGTQNLAKIYFLKNIFHWNDL
jgi:hypothetical protein